MSETYLIKIKKKYATAVIEDLQKMKAVEVIEELVIPQWQKSEVGKRLKDLQNDAGKAIGWKEGLKRIKGLNK